MLWAQALHSTLTRTFSATKKESKNNVTWTVTVLREFCLSVPSFEMQDCVCFADVPSTNILEEQVTANFRDDVG